MDNLPNKETAPQPMESEPAPDSGREGPVEREKVPETKGEAQPEQDGPKQEPAMPVATAVVPKAQVNRDPVLIEVESKMEDGLWEAYRNMPPGLRVKFKAEGERIAAVIRDGISRGRLAKEQVLDMVMRWLKMIPKVNRWFLIQEAKIKTDALVKLVEERSQSGEV